jgi:UDP-N-acetylglucosamine--N-acetylmuramyl-(pentapeptide) pyrophosphoryl-undecaprenol N-acetylglucosamine transferase
MPEVRHQTGAAQLDDALAAYSDAGVEIGANLSVSAFIDDMAAAYAWADLVLCRSGASTVSELAVAGRPSLLVPYPYHKDQQQHHNARWLSAVGGAIVIEQAALESAQLAAQLLALDTGREALHAMALAAHARAQRGVDVRIAALLRGKGDAR